MLMHLLYRFSYVGLLAVLVGAGMGLPVSEDLALLTGGYLAHEGITVFWLTALIGYVGVVVGDLLIFRIGKKLGERVYTDARFRKLFTPKRRLWIERHFRKRGILTVVIARHVGGLRAPTFLAAGAHGMPTRRFLIADAASAVVTVPLVTYLGYFFADRLDQVQAKLHHVQHWALAAVVAGVLATVLVRAVRRRRGAAELPMSPPPAQTSARGDDFRPA